VALAWFYQARFAAIGIFGAVLLRHGVWVQQQGGRELESKE
jgi:hypothetical protein